MLMCSDPTICRICSSVGRLTVDMVISRAMLLGTGRVAGGAACGVVGRGAAMGAGAGGHGADADELYEGRGDGADAPGGIGRERGELPRTVPSPSAPVSASREPASPATNS